MSREINVNHCSLSLRRGGACFERGCFKILRRARASPGKATKDGLKTVDEVAAEDKAEEATHDALD